MANFSAFDDVLEGRVSATSIQVQLRDCVFVDVCCIYDFRDTSSKDPQHETLSPRPMPQASKCLCSTRNVPSRFF